MHVYMHTKAFMHNFALNISLQVNVYMHPFEKIKQALTIFSGFSEFF